MFRETNLSCRSMNVGSLVDEKLGVRYTSGSEVIERRKKKRKENLLLVLSSRS